MTKIYLVRHCEALGNVKHIFQGVSNFDISEMGAKQLEFLTEKFKNIKLDKIYSSPLIRTYKTALAVKGDKSIEIENHNGLIELNGGFIEGKLVDETFKNHPELADAWMNHPQDFHPQDGEPMRAAYDRIYNAIIDIANNNRNKAVACATHGGVTRCLLCRLMFGTIEKLKNTPWAENTAITLLSIDDFDNIKLEFYSNTEHLPEEFLPKRSRLTTMTKG